MIKRTVVLLFFSFFLGNASAQEQSKGEFNLSNLINKAITYHPSIKSNIFLEDAAKNEITSAKWQYFPTPKFSVSQVDSSGTDLSYKNSDSRVLIISLTQPLWAGGSIDAGLAKSRAQLLLAQASTKATQQDLALKVINAYSKWYDSYLKKKSYSKNQEEHDILRARLRRRIKQGLSSSSDLNLANSRSTQAEAGLNSAIIQHENSLLNLEELLGTSLDPKDLIRDFSIVKFETSQAKLSKRALLTNPRIKQIRAESLVIEAELDQSRAKLYPDVNLKLERQWGSFTDKDVKTENRVFIELNSSFDAGLSNFSQIRQIKSRYQSLQVKIKDEENKVVRQIELDWMSSISLKKQKTLLESSLANTEKVRKSYYRQFLAGRKTWQDVMNSIREISQLESQLASVYGEIILVNWRIFVYVEDIGAVVTTFNESLAFNQTDKILRHPTMSSKEEQSAIDKMLNFVIPDEKPVEKIIWYSDMDSTQDFKSSLKKRDFVTFVEFFDEEEKSSREKLTKVAIQKKTTKMAPVEGITQKE
ncbi:TolC family protein [Candidatus Ruthia endofausta]|uniref:TolC family protein n=1 Tax=Candidatus Ruthia endofausta TaxID=2738852 RepID=A0A6N0HN49_9GAMM|nr:TolC family protein [Candidatus Ruthia endofausta]QKQ23743.1 TolC family protein [Candidatus Ruthia endofausta]